MKTTKRPSHMQKAIQETAKDLHKAGLLSDERYERITMRTAGTNLPPKDPPPLSPETIRRIREKEGVSQAVFALYVGVSPGVVSRWECGRGTPDRVASKLLHVVDKLGLSALT